ncbi:MAG: hypothetical protein ACI4CA_09395 [Bacteroides sp.]
MLYPKNDIASLEMSDEPFIFSGSQRHLMGEIFTSPARPFYQSVTLFNLQPIPLEKFHSITSYMQKVMNYLYQVTREGETCMPPAIDKAIRFILDLSSDTYESILYQMPEKQRNVLLAIARDGKARGISGGRFAQRHHRTELKRVSIIPIFFAMRCKDKGFI